MSEAKIVLSAVDQTKAAFDSMKGGLQGLHTSATGVIGVLGTLGVTAAALSFAASIKGAIDAADHINKLSQRTGIAAEALSQLQFAAKLSDVSADSLTTGIKKLNESIAAGLGGDKAKVEMFRNLGVSLRDAAGQAKSADKVLLDMAGSFSAAKDGATKTAYAVGLMGKAGDEMIPLLNGGTAAISEMMAKADKLGLTITSDFASKAETFNENLTILKSSSDRLAISLGGDLVNSLGSVAQKMADAAEKGGKLKGIIAGINEFGNQMFNWEAHQEFKGIDRLKGELDDLKVRAAAIKIDLFVDKGRAGESDQQVSAKQAELDAALAKYYRLTDGGTGGGRGVVNPPLVKPAQGSLPSLTGGGATTSEYDALIKSIKEKIAAQDQELQKGRELTEYEKFEIKILTDLDATKKILSATQKQAVKDKLAEASATNLLVAAQKEDIKQAKALNQFYIDQEKDLSADQVDRANERDRVNKGIADQATALQDSNQQLQLEATLMGATEKQRAIMLGNLQIELETKHKIEEVDRNLKLSESERVGMRANINNNADAQRAQLAERAALDEQLSMINSIESTAHSVWTNIFEGGKDAFTKLRDTLKATLLDLLYQMTVKKWVLSIGASITGSTGSLAQAAMGSAGGLGNLASLGNLAGSLGNFGAGLAGTGGSFASSVGAGLATDAMGATVTEGAAAATLGGASSIGAMMAAIPGWGWAALAAAAVVSFMNHGGGPKTEGGYAAGGLSIAGKDIGGNLQGSQRGDVSNAQSMSETISASYAKLAETMGLLDKKLDVGIFYSMDNAKGGTSLTQLQVTSSAGYNRSDRVGGIENVARGDDALKAALAEETVRLLIDGLKGSDLPQQFKDVFDGLAADAGVKDMGDAITRVTKARSEQLTLEGKLFDLTATDAQKLAKLRDQERAAVDPLNAALLDQVYVQQDLAAATTAANDKAKSVAAERAGLDKQIMQLTGDTAGLRKLELDALDESNRALQNRIYALQDEASATKAAQSAEDALRAYYYAQSEAMTQANIAAMQRAYADQQALLQSGKGISDYLRQLITGRAGTASPESTLASTRSNYISDLTSARLGDIDASGRVTGSAQAYIEAQKGVTASGTMTQAVISQVISELQAMPQVQSYESQVASNTAAMAARIGQLVDLTAAQAAHIARLLEVTAATSSQSLPQQAEIAANTANMVRAAALVAAEAPV
jgi:hypothetical protein